LLFKEMVQVVSSIGFKVYKATKGATK
jgi:hypothetical protein